MNERLKALFGDLGKPTMRGIRKCPKCGTFNGTRGMSCKNKSCNLIFKEAKEKKKINKQLDGIKLITGSDSQIYSVKVRDRGPDVRGFVILPLIEGLDGLQAAPEVELIIQSASQCHIDSCPRSKQDFSEVSLNVNTCRHITAAISSPSEAVALTLKNFILNSLPLESDMKQEIWQLGTETSGPLVQRISKSVMAVKCKTDEKHPLGYLHFYFFDNYRKQALSARAVCECEMPEVLRPGTWKKGQRCIHYYACICAFLSDKKLEEEFQSFINIDIFLPGVDSILLQSVLNGKQKEHNSVLPVESHDTGKTLKRSIFKEELGHKKRKKKDEPEVNNSDVEDNKPTKSKSQAASRKGFRQSSGAIDENEASFSFISWLGSVTERINQTMHFKFSGKPDPLVFHAPQIFFDCLQQRISSSSMKKRLPNVTTTFTRKDALPLGVFTKYTWHITSVLHVKQIFDTPGVPLQITRSFVENKDGTYDPYDPFKNGGKQLAEQFRKVENSPLIKPLELKTFLKVGSPLSGAKDSSVFTLEWIPNILPYSSIGEMRISFEYGHLRNGRTEIPAIPCKLVRLPS